MTIEEAREARRLRANTLRDLREHDMTVEQALRSDDRYVSCHSLWDILTAAYTIGPVRAQGICTEAGILDNRRLLAELMPDERRSLIAALPDNQKVWRP